MRQLLLTILFPLVGTISHRQESEFDLKSIKFKGLEFSTTKKAIIKYLEKELAGKTTADEFVKMFGEEVKSNFVKYA